MCNAGKVAQSCFSPGHSACSLLSLVQTPSQIQPQLHVLAQPGQEILCWKEASKQQELQGGGALPGAGSSKTGQMWLGGTASTASGDHKLLWSLTWAEQLLIWTSHLSSCSVWTSLLPFLGPPCQAVLQHQEHMGMLQRVQLWVKPAACYRERDPAGVDLGVDPTGCLCCVSARTSLQPCLEMPRASLAAYSAVKRLSCCCRICVHGSWKMFLPERPCCILLSVLGAALCLLVLL